MIKNATIKNSAYGFFMDGVFNGISYRVGMTNANTAMLYPVKVKEPPMLLDLSTITLQDTDGNDTTPSDLQDVAALLDYYIADSVSRVLVPFKSDITRRHYTRSEYTLPDLVGSNDGQLLPLASSVSSTSVITFTDLTGVAITSYEGDQVLSISGNTIVSSGAGVVHSLLLSNGSFYPIVHLYEDIVNSNKIIDLTDVNGVYDEAGSLHLQNYGYSEYNPELVLSINNTTLGINWSLVDGVFYADSATNYSACRITQLIMGVSYHIKAKVNLNSGHIRLTGIGSISSTSEFEYDTIIGEDERFSFFADSEFDGNIAIEVYRTTTPIYPHTTDGTPTIEVYYKDVAGSLTSLNLAPSKLRLFELGDTETYKACMDRSNPIYWKVSNQSLVSYDSDNPGDFLISEMNSTFFYTYASDTFKYQIWAKNKDNFLKDFFIYSAPLTGSDICKAKRYVGEWETYSTADADFVACSNDIASD